ncbi:MAG: hypothetical protein JSW71_02845, partial [Gemmatimonadota bacterium]
TDGAIVDLGESMLIRSQELVREDSTYTEALLSIAGDDTVRIASLTRPADRSIILFSCGLTIHGVAPVFSPELRWAVVGDGVAVTTSIDYEVMFHRDDAIVRILRRAIDPEPATWDAAIAAIGGSMRRPMRGGALVCDSEEVVEQRRMADVIPVIGALAPGPEGSLWVKRSAAWRAPAPIDVFEADGTYRGTLPEGSPFPVAVMGDRIAAIETASRQVQQLVVYRVVQ